MYLTSAGRLAIPACAYNCSRSVGWVGERLLEPHERGPVDPEPRETRPWPETGSSIDRLSGTDHQALPIAAARRAAATEGPRVDDRAALHPNGGYAARLSRRSLTRRRQKRSLLFSDGRRRTRPVEHRRDQRLDHRDHRACERRFGHGPTKPMSRAEFGNRGTQLA